MLFQYHQNMAGKPFSPSLHIPPPPPPPSPPEKNGWEKGERTKKTQHTKFKRDWELFIVCFTRTKRTGSRFTFDSASFDVTLNTQNRRLRRIARGVYAPLGCTKTAASHSCIVWQGPGLPSAQSVPKKLCPLWFGHFHIWETTLAVGDSAQ